MQVPCLFHSWLSADTHPRKDDETYVCPQVVVTVSVALPVDVHVAQEISLVVVDENGADGGEVSAAILLPCSVASDCQHGPQQ
jgi:hypothetical protein